MNTEERQLADMLRRVAPEPPGRVTVEDVAFRLANQAAGPGHRRHREALARRGSRSRAWAPALAAASVIVVAGASAGLAAMVTSNRGPVSPAGGTTSTSSPAASTSASSPAPSQVRPSWPPERVANGMWSAELINRDTFTQDSLTSGDGSLYAAYAGHLARIDPANGNILASVPYGASAAGPQVPGGPLVSGSTVWVLSEYAGTSVVLHGYDGRSLAQVASVAVPVTGQVSTTASGVLTAGPDGDLYVAAGSSVAVVNSSTRQVTRQISVSAGPVSSVAVSPDGSKLYASTGTLALLSYNPATGAQLGSSGLTDLTTTAGNLVATSGGVWGTTGVGMTESAWFAPGADLTRMVRLGTGAGAGLSSIPTFSGGSVWIGGSQKLVCASPLTGQVLASATIPTDGGVVEYFGSVTVMAGHAYAYYQDQRAQQFGVATLTPPGACSG